MKTFFVSIDYVDRRRGPMTWRRGRMQATSPHVAIYRYLRDAWKTASRKERNDMRRDGLKVECRETTPQSEPDKITKATTVLNAFMRKELSGLSK